MSKSTFLSWIIVMNLFVCTATAGTLQFTSRLQGTAVTGGAVLQTYDDQYFDMSATTINS